MNMIVWNPWHGCKKISPGCEHCYMYRQDEKIGKDSTKVVQTKNYYLPLKRNRNKVYSLTSLDNPIYVCMTSDFFIEEADRWRDEIWKVIRYRSDLKFKIITKRIHRMKECLPQDWWGGYRNVTIVCTCENQKTADERLPILLSTPMIHREIIHEPMLEAINIEPYLREGLIEAVTCGGESGEDARPCNYDWILRTREQCIKNNVSFEFHQTGAHFIKDGRHYEIERYLQSLQAKKANINFQRKTEKKPDPYEDILIELARSLYRSSFILTPKALDYCEKKGMKEIRREAFEAVRECLGKACYPNDGYQTPRNWHPIYTAMFATATDNRENLSKWHHIPGGRRLTENEINYIVGLLLSWITRQINGDPIRHDFFTPPLDIT